MCCALLYRIVYGTPTLCNTFTVAANSVSGLQSCTGENAISTQVAGTAATAPLGLYLDAPRSHIWQQSMWQHLRVQYAYDQCGKPKAYQRFKKRMCAFNEIQSVLNVNIVPKDVHRVLCAMYTGHYVHLNCSVYAHAQSIYTIGALQSLARLWMKSWHIMYTHRTQSTQALSSFSCAFDTAQPSHMRWWHCK